MNRWSSRKLLMMVAFVATSTILLVTGFIDQETWRWSAAPVAAYLLAQGYADAKK